MLWQNRKGEQTVSAVRTEKFPADTKTALFANGCFWCVEHDLMKVVGVLDVVSGYAGGSTENPTYENYAEGGHREVVLVTYDSTVVSYANLVEHILKHGDPTDADGSFGDRGVQYAPAIYVETETERGDASRVISAMDETKIFAAPLPIVVMPLVQFWAAEEYHQDYAEKNPLRYKYYRGGSGRDAFIQKYWNGKENEFTLTTMSSSTQNKNSWNSFKKPSDEELRQKLTSIQYEVTQKEGTERPFENAYDKHSAPGIYVDIVSGEPLFLSTDKYDSETGWPSFVKPVSPDAVVFKEDKYFFTTRTEVRSRYADAHLGHVFPDGPVDRGGMRYCMNSAALRFVPKADMEREGYGEYVIRLNK